MADRTAHLLDTPARQWMGILAIYLIFLLLMRRWCGFWHRTEKVEDFIEWLERDVRWNNFINKRVLHHGSQTCRKDQVLSRVAMRSSSISTFQWLFGILSRGLIYVSAELKTWRKIYSSYIFASIISKMYAPYRYHCSREICLALDMTETLNALHSKHICGSGRVAHRKNS